MHLPGFKQIQATWHWLKDLFAIPTRVRKLYEGLEADADPRPKCMSCAVGRVPTDRVLKMPGSVGKSYGGACTNPGCGAVWVTRESGRELSALWEPPAHLRPP